MKIIIPIKRVVDYNLKVRPKADGSGMDTATLKMSMNPFDEIALEEAVRLKEKGLASELIAISCGPAACQETLRTALAIGADRAVLIESELELQPLAVARLLHNRVLHEAPQLVICGKQAIDDDANQTGQMLAGLLGWAQASFASQLVLADDRRSASVCREVDGGIETLHIQLPAVITADLRLNTPRYATLPNIMKAKKKVLDIIAADSLGLDIAPHLHTLSVQEPPKRQAGVRVASVEELLGKLRDEAKLIPRPEA